MGIFSKFISKIKGVSTADPLDWQELEAELLAADLGPSLTSSIIKDAKSIKGDDAEWGRQNGLQPACARQSLSTCRICHH